MAPIPIINFFILFGRWDIWKLIATTLKNIVKTIPIVYFCPDTLSGQLEVFLTQWEPYQRLKANADWLKKKEHPTLIPKSKKNFLVFVLHLIKDFLKFSS